MCFQVAEPLCIEVWENIPAEMSTIHISRMTCLFYCHPVSRLQSSWPPSWEYRNKYYMIHHWQNRHINYVWRMGLLLVFITYVIVRMRTMYHWNFMPKVPLLSFCGCTSYLRCYMQNIIILLETLRTSGWFMNSANLPDDLSSHLLVDAKLKVTENSILDAFESYS